MSGASIVLELNGTILSTSYFMTPSAVFLQALDCVRKPSFTLLESPLFLAYAVT